VKSEELEKKKNKKESMLGTEFKEQAIYRMEESRKRVLACLDLVPEERIWEQPNPALNSIGNLVLHLCGNITQYIQTTLGGAADHRNRDAEFSTRGGKNKAELKALFEDVLQQSINRIAAATDAELAAVKSVQVYELSGIGIILHVTEHLSYHTGQIALLTKLITAEDLGFYKGLDLNTKHQ
jgi:uncharacterized damage-inducible protein DinB